MPGRQKYYYSIVRGVVKAVDGVTFDVKEKEISDWSD